MSQSIAGRVALVTGASSGIGEATDAGGDAHVIVADLAHAADAARSVHDTERAYGRLDILVNNAGVMYLEPVAEADLGRWRRMLELNVLGLIAATQAVLAGVRQRRDGHIVNVSSVAGRLASPAAAGYSATKFGVVAFSEALRQEIYRDNIRVTVIEPGMVATELREHIAHAESQRAINSRADGMRQLQSVDIANAILFAVLQPSHVSINEMLIRPTDQER